MVGNAVFILTKYGKVSKQYKLTNGKGIILEYSDRSKGNTNSTKHGGYGLKKRVETGLTTKNDYKRYTALLNKWGLEPAKVEAMGMLGSAIEMSAWLQLIAEDATGAYLYVKETSDDMDTIVRLGRNASYQGSKAIKSVLELHTRLQAQEDTLIIDALTDAEGYNSD